MTEKRQQLIRGMRNLRPEHRGSAVTIGAFDGVHLGHQAIIRQVVEQAQVLGVVSTVVIFEPLPREYFQGAVARILPFREKCQALFAQGIERIVCLRFNRQLSDIAPEAFVRQLLVDGLGVQHLVVGDDFRFGKNREGDRALLARQANHHGFTLSRAVTVSLGGERVSSTRIRECLAAADFAGAEACLGRPFAISGKVIYGKQLGRQLGIPTANVDLKRINSPLQGTFAGWVLLADGSRHTAVINVGVRPTVNDQPKALLEAHLLDFNASLYGHRVKVQFACKLRDEQKFPSVEVLKTQIHRDIAQAKEYFQLLSSKSEK